MILKTLFSCCVLPLLLAAEPAYQPTAENLQAREWFRDSKFGLFIHWGPYSVLENGEWVLEKAKLSLEEYEREAVSQFNPTQFDPASWVALAKAAGMKYITITSRHHDGYAMWATKQNDWNVIDASPCKTDLLKLLAEECRREEMKLFFYYSQLDWHHADYFPLGKTGHSTGRSTEGEFNQYLDYMDAQLTELLTEYGDVAGIWFDGMWDKPEAEWRLGQTYSLIHRLQPQALVGSNHHLDPFDGEDIQMFEKDLPGQATGGFCRESTSISSLPLETCETMNHSWGYDNRDQNYKSTKELIHYLVKAAGNNANFLLNVGPRSDGTIQPEFVQRLEKVGEWLKKNGRSIYGTRGGPFKAMPWGVVTRKGNKLYVHVLNWNSEPIAIPVKNIARATLFSNGANVKVMEGKGGLELHLNEDDIDEIDTIVELELDFELNKLIALK